MSALHEPASNQGYNILPSFVAWVCRVTLLFAFPYCDWRECGPGGKSLSEEIDVHLHILVPHVMNFGGSDGGVLTHTLSPYFQERAFGGAEQAAEKCCLLEKRRTSAAKAGPIFSDLRYA